MHVTSTLATLQQKKHNYSVQSRHSHDPQHLIAGQNAALTPHHHIIQTLTCQWIPEPLHRVGGEDLVSTAGWSWKGAPGQREWAASPTMYTIWETYRMGFAYATISGMQWRAADDAIDESYEALEASVCKTLMQITK